MDGSDAARILFEIGAAGLIFAGVLHAALTLYDVRRPTFFTPVRDEARVQMDRGTIRFIDLFPGRRRAPSTWRTWLGFNVSHGLGLLTFGLFCLLLAAHDFGFVVDTGFLLPIAAGISAVYLILGVAFWFWLPTLLLSLNTACFILAWALA